MLMIALLTVFLSTGVFAQWTNSYGYTFNNPTSATLNSFIWDRMNERQIYKVGLRKKGYTDSQMNAMSTDELKAAYIGAKTPLRSSKKTLPATVQPARNSLAATVFKPSGKRILMPKLMAEMMPDEEKRAALIALFENALHEYEIEAKSAGLANDVAGAIAYFAAVSFYLQDGEEASDKGTEALAKALQVALDTPEYRKVSNADKQGFYEFMLTMGSFALFYAQDADAAKRNELREVTSAVCKEFLKLDPSKVRLTDEGIVAR